MGLLKNRKGQVIQLRNQSGRRFRGYTPYTFQVPPGDDWLVTHLYCIPPADRTPPYPDEPLFTGDIVLRTEAGVTCFRAPARSLMDVYYRLVFGVDDPDEVLGVAKVLRELESIQHRRVFNTTVYEEIAKVITAWRACLAENSGTLPIEAVFHDGQTLVIERDPPGAPLEVEIRGL